MMGNRWTEEALDHLDPALIEDMDSRSGTRTRPAPVRVLLAAACVCALLVVGTVAAGVAGFDFVKIFMGEEKKTIYYTIVGSESEGIQKAEPDYEVDGSGIVYIPLKDLSPEVQALEEQYKDTDRHVEHLFFDSWEGAEEYLGYEIMDNFVLAQGTYSPVRLSTKGTPLPGNCAVDIHLRNGGEVYSIDVISRIDLFESTPERPHGFEWYEVRATLYVGGPLPGQTEAPTVGYKFDDEWMTVKGQESYLTPSGLETVIVNIEQAPLLCDDGSEYQGGEYHTHFFLHGVRLEVWTTYSAEERETILATLKDILDNFQ